MATEERVLGGSLDAHVSETHSVLWLDWRVMTVTTLEQQCHPCRHMCGSQAHAWDAPSPVLMH